MQNSPLLPVCGWLNGLDGLASFCEILEIATADCVPGDFLFMYIDNIYRCVKLTQMNKLTQNFWFSFTPGIEAGNFGLKITDI